MSLYERDYVKSTDTTQAAIQQSERVSFIKQTYQLLAASMIAAAAGAYATLPIAESIMKYRFLIFIVELAILFFGLRASRGKPGLNLIMLFAFTFLTGVSLVPLLAYIIGLGHSAAIGNAFLATAVLFAALSIFAINSKTDFSSWGKALFIVLIVVIVASLINIFFLQSPILHVIIMAVTMLLFGLLTIYDTQNIANGAYESPVDASISLYLDFLNMFTIMLQFFGLLGDE